MAKVETVVLLSEQKIHPATPTPTEKRHYTLSQLDAFWRDIHYNRRIIFYRPCPELQQAAAMESLKHSLSQALVHYYPWSGRLALDDQNRLFIDCNDAGVEFVEAKLESVAMAELENSEFQMRPWFDELCRHVDHKGEALYKSPLLSVQATAFPDGGIAVGVAQNHVAADGQALWEFLVSWGDIARTGQPAAPPFLDRTVSKLKGPPSLEKASKWSFLLNTGDDEDPLDEQHMDPADTENKDYHESDGEDLTQCVVQISGDAIRRLKESLNGEYTSYEGMCAHFWQRITAARRLPATERVLFSNMANCRTRLQPALPASFFGNAVVFCTAVSSAGHVASPERLAATTARIRRCIRDAASVDLIQAYINWLELHGNRMVDALPPEEVKDHTQMDNFMNVASSPRFPVYEVDFGWGRPAGVRAAKVIGNGEMVLFPGRPGRSSVGDMEICLCLRAGVLRRLLRDPLFLATTRVSPFDIRTS